MSAHVDDALPELVIGTLAEPERTAVAAHIAGCARCADELRATQEALAALAIGLPAPPLARGRELVLDAITPGTPDVRRFARFRRRFARLYDLPEASFDEIVPALADPSRWEPALPGVMLFHFTPGPKHAGADAGFVRFQAGARFPMHRHPGDEYMFLFAGGFRDDASGAEAHPGDILYMTEGSSHSFTFFPEEDCLSAVLLYGGPPILLEGFDGPPR